MRRRAPKCMLRPECMGAGALALLAHPCSQLPLQQQPLQLLAMVLAKE